MILDTNAFRHVVARMAHAIMEHTPDPARLVCIGIRQNGSLLKDRLIREIAYDIPSGDIDITMYRDDLFRIGHQPVVAKSEIPCSLDARDVILVDSVIYTGRTVRAAIDALFDYGRPRCVRLAALIDRGGRELPFQPDFLGRKLDVPPTHRVHVMFEETDGIDGVAIREVPPVR